MQFFWSSHSFNCINLVYEVDSESEDSADDIKYRIITAEPKYSNILDVNADAQLITTNYIVSLMQWFNEEEQADNTGEQINLIKTNIYQNIQASKSKLFCYT